MSNYKYTFFDNQLIGVDQLNEITSRLVSGGVSAVYSGADFNVSEINDSNKLLLTGGVVPGNDMNLKVVAMGSGKYLINPGICFFEDGTSMEILSGGEVISVPVGTVRYVYLTSDKNQMKCYVEISDGEKQSGQFVLLSIVNADGTVADKRTYAKGKVPGFYASSQGKEVNISETYKPTDLKGEKYLEIDVGNGNFHHLCIKVNGVFHDSAGYKIDYGGLFYCEFENGVATNQGWSAVKYGGHYLFYGDSTGHGEIDPDVKIQSGKLKIHLLRCVLDKNVTFEYHLW